MDSDSKYSYYRNRIDILTRLEEDNKVFEVYLNEDFPQANEHGYLENETNFIEYARKSNEKLIELTQ